MLEILGLVAAGLALGVVVVLAVGAVRIVRLRRRHRARLATIGPLHSEPARLFGVASDGRTQTRGVGTLAVSHTDVLFVQLVPERDLWFALADVTSVRSTPHFMGKQASRDLLVVTWETNGLGDAAALDVADADAWRERLQG
ncbi:hypothetical protein ACHAAC_06005 [Aeromicrobium sp. CF4.19]|uniref:hypothetical protein n=1 Tax=Aeromicrobium sp. CF4.19 TaxID=3373082 RepID=UPI003EE75594